MHRALYSYHGDRDGLLSFKVGDLVRFVGVHKDGWIDAESGTGQVGKVPVNYFEQVCLVYVFAMAVFLLSLP